MDIPCYICGISIDIMVIRDNTRFCYGCAYLIYRGIFADNIDKYRCGGCSRIYANLMNGLCRFCKSLEETSLEEMNLEEMNLEEMNLEETSGRRYIIGPNHIPCSCCIPDAGEMGDVASSTARRRRKH